MATAVQVESLWNGLTDNNGQPLAAGKVYTYSAGTTNPVSLFTSADKSSSATNPLILDAYGKSQVWADGRYKFVVKTSADVTLYTLDNLLYGFDDTTILYGGASTGSANAQVVSVPATVTSYANGQTVSFVASYTNTGATTLQFNSLSAVNLVKGATPSSLQAGDLIAGQLYTATYHGGSFRLQDYPSVADVQRSRFLVASSVAGVNTITANLSPAPSSYETGMLVWLVAANANTSAGTLNLNGLGAKAIQRQGTALVGGEIKAGDVLELFYDGTQFQLINVPAAPLFVDKTNNRVGVGTTTPSATLEIGSITGNQINSVRYSADTTPSQLLLGKSRGATVGANALVINGDVVGQISFQAANGTSYDNVAAIQAAIDGVTGASGDMPGRLVFATTPDGSGSVVERMRIDNAGNIGIGMTPGVFIDATRTANDTLTRFRLGNWSNGASATSRFELGNDTNITASSLTLQSSTNTTGAGGNSLNLINGLNAPIAFWANGAERMRITAGGKVYIAGTTDQGAYNLQCNGTGVWGAGAYVNGSDERIKEEIAPIGACLNAVIQLNPITFKYKEDWITDRSVQSGFIAQELQTVFAGQDYLEGLVNTNGTYLSVAYQNLIPVLTKAIQELNAKVELLEARVAELEA